MKLNKNNINEWMEAYTKLSNKLFKINEKATSYDSDLFLELYENMIPQEAINEDVLASL